MLAERLAEAVHKAHAVGAVAATLHCDSGAPGGDRDLLGPAQGSREYAAAGSAAPDRPMTPETPVRIASITKPMLAMAVFRAFRADPDRLDAPVRDFFPDLETAWHNDVTLRRVLSHTGGLRSLDEATLNALGKGDDALTEAVRWESRLPYAWRPGSAWAYCNPGFRLAGAILARHHGTTFEQAMRDLLLDPAGMRDSGFDRPAGAAVGHRKGVPQPDSYGRSRRPGGGLWSTVGDVLSFAEYAMSDSAFTKLARTQHSPAAMGHCYGFGWFLNARADLMFHFGDVGGFRGLLVVAPDHQAAAVVVGNDEHGGAISRDVAFREIANRTGLQRPRPAPKRLAYAAVRQMTAKVLA